MVDSRFVNRSNLAKGGGMLIDVLADEMVMNSGVKGKHG